MGQVREVGEVKGGEVKETHLEDVGHGRRLRGDGGPIEDGGNGGAVAAVAPLSQVP